MSNRGTGLSLQQIKHKLELLIDEAVAQRTLERDLAELRSLTSLDIPYDRANGTYRLSSDEAIDHLGLYRWYLELSYLGALLREFTGARPKGRKVLMHLGPELRHGLQWVEPLIKAVAGWIVVDIDYERFEGRMKSHHVIPLLLVTKLGRWYVVVEDVKRHHIMTLGLDRILRVKVTEEVIAPREGFDPATYWTDSTGVYVGVDDPEVIEIKVSIRQAPYLRTLPIHHSQEETSSTKTHVMFRLLTRGDFELILLLQQYGPDLEVLRPVWLRDEMRDRARRLNDIYQES